MVRWLSRFFHYLDRYFIARRTIPGLKEVGLISFRELVTLLTISRLIQDSLRLHVFLLNVTHWLHKIESAWYLCRYSSPCFQFSFPLLLKLWNLNSISGISGDTWESDRCNHVHCMFVYLLAYSILLSYSGALMCSCLIRLIKSGKACKQIELC